MKPFFRNILVTLFFVTTFSSVIANNSAKTAPFSPYADMTLETHWDDKTQSLQPVDLVAISQTSHVKNYHLAFITDAGNCSPAWGGYPTYSASAKWGSQLTDQLRAHQIAYTVSFGGASGNDLSMMCTPVQLVSVFEEVIQNYHPEGLDFDIENGTARVENIISALQKIQKAHPNLTISFTLPVLPDGLTFSGQSIITQARDAGLHFRVNIMAMDYGPTFVGDMGDYAVTATTNLFSFLKRLYPGKSDDALWGMIEVTPMIGVNDISSESFTLDNADKLRAFAEQHSLAGISMWSIAHDFPCANPLTSNTCSGNNLQANAYEFSKNLMG